MTVPPMSQAEILKERPRLFMRRAVVLAAVAAVYLGGLHGAFLYDDLGSIPENPSIRHLATALNPPAATTVDGRPFLNFTFALNFAVSGTDPWSYHLLNIALHGAAALLLFEILLLTLAGPACGSLAPASRRRIAFAGALLWAVHPLQTESVSYVVQRAESLMGFLYLLTLYAFIRHAQGGRRARAWEVACAGACLLGMATKEVMATAPLIVLLYDRTFLAGSFREAWRVRRGLYLALAAGWVPLGLLVAQAGGRAGTAGLSSGVSPAAYLAAQMGAVTHYVKLAFWPDPLLGDYGRVLSVTPLGTAAGAVFVAALAGGTLWALVRRPALGFLGAWFLVILAPSSSVIPVATEIVAEHRMYLPLAAWVVLAVAALHRWLGGGRGFTLSVLVVAAGLGVSSWRRSGVYAGPSAFWSDVANQAPENAGAWNNLGVILMERGDLKGAVRDFGKALDRAPQYATAHFNLGRALNEEGRPEEAAAHFEAALAFMAADASVHCEYGKSLALLSRPSEAAEQYRIATRLEPSRPDAWYDLGATLVQMGDLPGAAKALSRTVALSPDYAEARIDYANVLAQQGDAANAIVQYGEAIRIKPSAADAHNNRGILLAQSGRLEQARAEFEEALRLKPNYTDARDNLNRLNALEGGGARP